MFFGECIQCAAMHNQFVPPSLKPLYIHFEYVNKSIMYLYIINRRKRGIRLFDSGPYFVAIIGQNIKTFIYYSRSPSNHVKTKYKFELMSTGPNSRFWFFILSPLITSSPIISTFPMISTPLLPYRKCAYFGKRRTSEK